MAAMFATQTMESYSNSQQTSTPALIKTPQASNLSFTGQWQGPEIRTQRHGDNELEGTRAESSAQIVHAVDLHSLHFNIIRKNLTH
jgi:hypothetical protein